MTALNEQSVVPEFAHAVRGYDRYQVDDYIERLNEWAGGASTRAMDAERRVQEQAEDIRLLRERLTELEQQAVPAPDQALEQAAQRAAEAIAEAVKQADEIRRRAVADAEKQADDASRQAVATVQAAHQAISRLTEEATSERRRAKERADAIIKEASERGGEIVSTAKSDSDRLLSEAHAAAEVVQSRTELERRQAADAVQGLQEEREEILAELNRLRGAIQTLISGAGSQTGEAAPSGA